MLRPMENKKFGRWTVIRFIEKRKSDKYWLCRCECGTEKAVAGKSLRKGDSRSCGCLQKEISKEANTTHGLAYHPLYLTWSLMIHRCYNKDYHKYSRYGGRGIEVYEEWKNDVGSFVSWVAINLGDKPDKTYTLDRINNDGNYEPGNLRWGSPKTQRRNQNLSTCNFTEKEVALIRAFALTYPKTKRKHLYDRLESIFPNVKRRTFKSIVTSQNWKDIEPADSYPADWD